MTEFSAADRMADGGWQPGLPGAGLETLLQQMPAGVVIAEAPGGRLLLVNRQMESIWRRPFVLTQDVADYASWQGFHSDGRPYAAEEWPLARSITLGEVVESEEIEIQRGDGSRGMVCINSAPVRDEGGRIVRAVATAFDVTDQRRQERTRRFLAEATACLAGSLDYETTLRNVVHLAVPTLADWCNLDVLHDDGRIERLAMEHVDPGLAELAREMTRRYPPDPDAELGAARVLRTGQPELLPEIDEGVLRRVARDDAHLEMLRRFAPHSRMIVPLRARGRTLGALSFISTRSRRRYGPADLAQAEELAVRAGMAIDNARLYHESQAANRAKSDFLAVISHELRTPLTAVIGYAELLGLGVPEPLTDRQREQVERIEVSAQHLLHLIEEILGLVSLEGGKTHPRRETVRAAEVVRRAAVIAEPMARAHGLGFSVTPPERALTLETDPDHLVQVLLNLLSNAVKFTESGEVRLAAQRIGDELCVEVSDTGIGLSEQERRQVFDPFWQAEQPITRRAGGTGLGLTITLRLLRLLGGRIEVDSEPGVGSAFRVWLPLQAPVPEP